MKSRNHVIALAGLLTAACGGSGSVPPPANQPPAVGAVADQTTTANQPSAPIPFTVSDEQAANLSLSASSDNQQVVPDDGLELGGSGASRNLTVTPAADTTGDAFVTIIATDPDGLAASATFLLTVVAEQVSMKQFARTQFDRDEPGDPVLINAVEFVQDADDDDFADLLAP